MSADLENELREAARAEVASYTELRLAAPAIECLHLWRAAEALSRQREEIARLEQAATFRLRGACGDVHVAVGTRFASDGVVWEITGPPKGPMTYSPDSLGGTPTVRCRVVKGTPDGRFTPYMEDGEVDWCGDSVASAILAPHVYGRMGKLEEEIARLNAALDEAAQQIYDSISKGEARRRVEEEANIRAAKAWAAAIEAAAKVARRYAETIRERVKARPELSGYTTSAGIEAAETIEDFIRALATPERAAEEPT